MNLGSCFDVSELDQHFKNWAGISLIVYRIFRGLPGDWYLGMCDLPVTSISLPIKSSCTSVGRRAVTRLFRLCRFLPHKPFIFDSTNRITRFLMGQLKIWTRVASVVTTSLNWFCLLLVFGTFVYFCWSASMGFYQRFHSGNVWLSTSTGGTPVPPQQDWFFYPLKIRFCQSCVQESLWWQTWSPRRIPEVGSFSLNVWDVLFLFLMSLKILPYLFFIEPNPQEGTVKLTCHGICRHVSCGFFWGEAGSSSSSSLFIKNKSLLHPPLLPRSTVSRDFCVSVVEDRVFLFH